MVKNVVIVNGNPEKEDNEFNSLLVETSNLLKKDGLKVSHHLLLEKNIKQCVGCFDCWWKTPGICRFDDDTGEILRDIINSDLTIFAAPLIMGMYSALLKKFQDRLIPLIHPYLEMVENECHHRVRYPKRPLLGIIIDENDATKEEIENTEHICNRMAINFQSEVNFFYSIQQKQSKEISYEISHI